MMTTAHTICPFCSTRTRPPGEKTCGARLCGEALHYQGEVKRFRWGSSMRAHALMAFAAACQATRAEARAPRPQ